MNKCKVYSGIIGLVLIFLWLLCYRQISYRQLFPILGFNLFLNTLLIYTLVSESLERLKEWRDAAWFAIYFIYYISLLVVFLSYKEPLPWVIGIILLMPLINVIASFIIWIWWMYEVTQTTISSLLLAFLPFPFALIFLLSPFYLIPLSIYIGEKSFNQYLKLRLSRIQDGIEKLEGIIKKHENILKSRQRLEEKINDIIALYPANFSLKSKFYCEQAKQFNDNEIQKRLEKIEEDIQKTAQLRMNVERKLEKLEHSKEEFENRLEEIRLRLRKIEIMDPANIKIKLQNLQNEWKNLGEKELESIETTGELEQLYKEQLLSTFQIEELDREVKEINKELTSLKLAEDALILEKLIFQLEKLDRDIKREEPRLLQMSEELEELRAKRNKIKQSLHATKIAY